MSNLHRIQWIDAALRENRFPNCARIAEEFGISVRQASRDVDYLKYSLGAPLEYSFTRRGYYYAAAAFVLPAVFLGKEEKEAIEYLADRYRSAGGEATAKLAAFFEKLRPGGEAGKRRLSSDVPVYLVKDGQIKTYGLLKEAAARRRKVRIAYLDNGNRKSVRVIRPYAVFIKERADYVHAFCEARNAERDFRLDRISVPELLEEGFTLPAAFDPARYQADFRFDFRLPYRALVRFDHPLPAACPLDLVPAGDGEYTADFSDSTELFRKLVSFSSGFTIVAPLWLRRKFYVFSMKLSENNKPPPG